MEIAGEWTVLFLRSPVYCLYINAVIEKKNAKKRKKASNLLVSFVCQGDKTRRHAYMREREKKNGTEEQSVSDITRIFSLIAFLIYCCVRTRAISFVEDEENIWIMTRRGKKTREAEKFICYRDVFSLLNCKNSADQLIDWEKFFLTWSINNN